MDCTRPKAPVSREMAIADIASAFDTAGELDSWL